MNNLSIAIGGDHAGFDLKETLIGFLSEEKISFKDFGPYSDERVDYPDFAHAVASAVENEDYTFGVLICGSANGVAMTANKHSKVRAGLAWNQAVGAVIRAHNDANVICLPSRFIDPKEAIETLKAFLSTEFEGGRHQGRIVKIPC